MRSYPKGILPYVMLLQNFFINFDSIRAAVTTTESTPECQCMEWYYCDINTYVLDDKKNCTEREHISCCKRPSIKKLPSLVADCGLVLHKHVDDHQLLKRSTPSDNTSISEEPAEYGDDPWNVALYRHMTYSFNNESRIILLCSGTLISPTVVISAAHCFYDSNRKTMQNDTSVYEIYVGKYKRDYYTHDSDSQKVHKIKKLVHFSKNFSPRHSGYGHDVILIVLEEPVTVGEFVRPICLDWSGMVFGALLDSKTPGRVVSWRLTETGIPSEYLLTNDMPYIDFNSCLEKVSSLPPDQFCAGSPSNPGWRRGGSGAGFVSKYNGRYFLRGLASAGGNVDFGNRNDFVGGYTDLESYMPWIRENMEV